MRNLAGESLCDNIICQELLLAHINIEGVGRTAHEVPYSVIGRLENWTFERSWCYWRANTFNGNGVPKDKAEGFNDRWNEEVRIAGYAGGTEVAKHLSCKETIDTYHIDTERGLQAFAKLIRRLINAS